MQQHRPRQRQIIIQPALNNDFRQRGEVTEEEGRNSPSRGGDTEQQHHVIDSPAAHLVELVKVQHPEEKISAIVDEHEHDLRQKCRAEFHGRLQVGFPEREKEFEMSHA